MATKSSEVSTALDDMKTKFQEKSDTLDGELDGVHGMVGGKSAGEGSTLANSGKEFSKVRGTHVWENRDPRGRYRYMFERIVISSFYSHVFLPFDECNFRRSTDTFLKVRSADTPPNPNLKERIPSVRNAIVDGNNYFDCEVA